MSLVEVVIAAAIILLISSALITADLAYLKTARTNLATTKAIYLLEEGTEVVNFLKNELWENLGDVNTDYYLSWAGFGWEATSTAVFIDEIYERKFYTAEVNRDGDSDIVESGGTVDPDTRQLTVIVSWADQTGTTTKSLVSYLMKRNADE